MYLVTGGAGFIGSHVASALTADGQSVRVLDDLSNGTEANLEALGGDVEFVQGDICDQDSLERSLRGVHTVFHLAALGSVPRSIENPIRSNEVNVGGTVRLLDAARRAGVRKVVYSSSSSVYGDNPALPKHEGLATNPISPYATSKLAAENYTRVFHRVYGMDTVCLRYFNVFGPRQRPDSQYAAVIPLFMKGAAENTPVTVFGDGRQSRDFTYVANVVHANLLAARREGVAGGVFNVACGGRHSLLEILEELERLVGHPLERRHEPPRPGDVPHSMAAIDAAREKLGFEVKVGFAEGLERTWRAYCEAWRG